MRKRGLNVVPVDAAASGCGWRPPRTLYPQIRGKIVPADAFDEAMRFRDEYRQAKARHRGSR